MLIEFSCIYFNVDHFRTGGRCGRKRIRTDSIVDNAVYRLQFAPKSLKHAASDQEMRFKMCFYVGEWKVMSTAEVKAIWVTALHGGLEMDTTFQIH